MCLLHAVLLSLFFKNYICVASIGFEAPFNNVDASGDRQVKDWTTTGDAKVLQNFVRLTHARENKSGAFWSDRQLGVQEFSALLKFRMSGQEKTEFGEGLALWFVQSPMVPGTFHGFTEQFTGFGLIFDNYRPSGSRSHLDIQLVINDGQRTATQMLADQLGCSTRMRYHEGRADFSVFNATRVSISYKQTTLTIGIDSRNRNDWLECITVRMQMGSDWLKTARIGFTATTNGNRVDNHDVVSLKVFPYAEDIQTAGIEDVTTPDRNTLEHLVQHLEHQLAAVQASLQTNIHALRQQETRSQDRIQKLEDSLSLKLMGALETRIQTLESLNLKQLRDQEMQAEGRISKLEEELNSQVHRQLEERLLQLQKAVDDANTDQIESRIGSLEKVLQEGLEERIEKLDGILKAQIQAHVDLVEGQSHTYSLPFLAFSAAIVAGLLWLWWKYRGLKKRHML